MSWQLVESANLIHKDNNSKSVWKIRNQKSAGEIDLNMLTIMNLVRESKIHKVERREIWKTLLKHRWDIEILKTSSCLNETQVAKVIYKIGQEMNLKNDWSLWISEEDQAFGTELYSIFHYCPEHLVEAAKLSAFFESLLNKENLNTVVAATMQNIQPRAGDNIKDFTAINMWYERLDERYNFSLGSNILPLLTTENLKQLKTLTPPFLKAVVNDAQNYNISRLVGKI